MIKVTLTTEIGTVLEEYNIPEDEVFTIDAIEKIITLSRYANEKRNDK